MMLPLSLEYNFSNPELLVQALTHKSFRNENPSQVGQPAHQPASQMATQPVGQVNDNEKLEFLGDAVLDLALSQYLMARFPHDQEGALSKKRASLVNEESLSVIALKLALDQFLRLGKGEKQTGGALKPRLLASSFEAVIGAVFLDSGYQASYQFIEKIFAPYVSNIAEETDYATDFKTRLQELAQENYKLAPTYRVDQESGPDHDKRFEASVLFEARVLGNGVGRSKKAAEQDAARAGLEIIGAELALSSAPTENKEE